MQASDGNGVAQFAQLSQEERDAAYNNSAAVADSAARLADWTERSAACRARSGVRRDLRYGARERNCFDYFPSGARGAPLFVFFHGGYWQNNSKETFGFVAEGPCARGIDVATVGYTLAPEAHLSDIVDEIHRAMDHIAGMANELGFDAGRVCAGGWSAGGHLAALAAERPEIGGTVPISGIFDLEPIALTYLNEKLGLSRFEIETLAPLRRPLRKDVTVSLLVGGDELPELQRQSQTYERAARANGVPVSLRTLPGLNHYSIMEEFAAPDGLATRTLIDILDGLQA